MLHDITAATFDGSYTATDCRALGNGQFHYCQLLSVSHNVTAGSQRQIWFAQGEGHSAISSLACRVTLLLRQFTARSQRQVVAHYKRGTASLPPAH